MAHAVKVADLTDEQKKEICTRLIMCPKVKFNFGGGFGGYSNQSTQVTSFPFFVEENGELLLPYLFASQLLKVVPNQGIIRPKFSLPPLSFTGSLYEHQKPVAEECWNQLLAYGTTTLCLRCAFGKSLLGCYLSYLITTKTKSNGIVCVLITRDILLKQWYKTFSLNFTCKIWRVGEEQFPVGGCNVIICMALRWRHVPPEIRAQVTILIVDEAHLFLTKGGVMPLLAWRPDYIIIETATLERENEMQCMAYALVGTHKIVRINEKPFTVIKYMVNIIPTRQMTRQNVPDYSVFIKSLADNPDYNKIIIDLVLFNINNPNFKILVMTKRVDHAIYLHSVLSGLGVSTDYMVGPKKQYKDSKVLVSNISKLGVGFDSAMSALEYDGQPINLLILTTTIKSISTLEQVVGRAQRANNPTIIQILANDKICENHWKLNKPWYSSRSGNITIWDTIPKDPKGKPIVKQKSRTLQELTSGQ